MAKVLIIEDDPDVAEVERLALEAAGHTAQVAGDGPTGVLAARRFQPDAVVLDVGLPLFDGNAVLFGLDLNPDLRGVAVVVVSGRTAQLDDFSERRVTAVISKPFSLDEFVDAVEQAVQRAASHGDQ